MLLATTEAVKIELAENSAYSGNQNSLPDLGASSKAAIWGNQTDVFRSERQRGTRRDSGSRTDRVVSEIVINNILFSAWVEKIDQTLGNWNESSLAAVVRLSQRYLYSLRSSADHRIFISSLLNVFRFTPDISEKGIKEIERILEDYRNSNISKEVTISFIRRLRSSGFSPSSMGKLSVE